MVDFNQNQFGITPHEHVDLLKNAWHDYEGKPKIDWDTGEEVPGEKHSYGQRERGHPYGPEDFKVLRVEQLPEPDKHGSTHEVEIQRGNQYHTLYGWNRDTGEKSMWAD